MVKKSYRFYIPIIIALTFGYILGAVLTFGIHYLGVLPSISNETARLTLKLFGMGVFGSTLYCTRWWAKDMDQAIDEPKFLPHLFDTFGYLTTIIGGGITGVVLYMLTKAGFALAATEAGVPDIKFSAALVLAFCGGLFHFLILTKLEKFINKSLGKI